MKNNVINKANKKLELLLNNKIVSYTIFEKGVDHLVWKVDFNEKSYVLKIGERVIIDKYLLNLLEKINLKSPKVIYFYEIKNEKCLVMEYIEGEMLSKHKDNLCNYLEEIILELKFLHNNFQYDGGGYVNDYLINDLGKWSIFLKKIIDSPVKEKNWDNILPKNHYGIPIINNTRMYLINNINIIKDNRKNSILHFDINPSNVIIENGKLKSIIDWSDSRIGDPLYDFARLRLTLEHIGEKHLISKYYEILKLNEEEINIEKYYFYHIALEYVYHFYSIHNEKYVDKTLKILNEINL